MGSFNGFAFALGLEQVLLGWELTYGTSFAVPFSGCALALLALRLG